MTLQITLEDKVAVVTGAATGIGRECAFHLARAGAAVVVNYVGKPDDADAAVAQIRKAGSQALAVEADVSESEDVARLIAETVKEFGRLDILINNAGIEKEMPFLETPMALWAKIIAINLTGPWLCTQAAAKQMVRQGGGGRIINISSVHEDMPMPTNSPYCASKGGLRMLMRTLAVELAPHKITVNNIGPGAIDTPLDKPTKDDPQKMKMLLETIPLGRMGLPEEVANLAVFLGSDAAAYITGSTYFIDGGMLRQAGSL
jgi:glucose 1-dehydrogenase